MKPPQLLNKSQTDPLRILTDTVATKPTFQKRMNGDTSKHPGESLQYCSTDSRLSTLGHRGIYACGDDVRLSMEAVAAEGTTRHEIGAGRP